MWTFGTASNHFFYIRADLKLVKKKKDKRKVHGPDIIRSKEQNPNDTD